MYFSELECDFPAVPPRRPSATKKKRQLPSSHSPSSSPLYYTLDAHRSTAVELNQMGADLLSVGEPLPAIETLRDAVDFLSQPEVRIHAGDDAALMEYASKHNGAIERAEMRLLEAHACDDGETSRGKKKTTADEEGPLLVWSEPIRLLSPSTTSGGAVCDEEAAATVLFNLALAHHLAGSASTRQRQQPSSSREPASSSPARRRAMIDKSQVFYELCITAMLKIDAPNERASSIDGGVPHLARAALNNAGQICLRWGNHAAGRKYFSDLRTIVCCGTEEDGGCDAPRVRAEEGMDLFSFNAMVAGQLNAAPTA
uniref:Uncharacterized protein n=1 Tax=Odontella aurita TaxID=265563 RepID=A0A7S4MYM6_9STRA